MLFRRHAVMFLATAGYVGRFPTAPGTLGSLAGIPIAFALSRTTWPMASFAASLLTLAAVWVAGAAARQLNADDPGCIVIDEVAGMVVTLIGLPFTLVNVAAGFIVFRIFDISKPPPVRQLERRLKGGWGIVMDDIAAGLMANIVIHMGRYLIH